MKHKQLKILRAEIGYPRCFFPDALYLPMGQVGEGFLQSHALLLQFFGVTRRGTWHLLHEDIDVVVGILGCKIVNLRFENDQVRSVEVRLENPSL